MSEEQDAALIAAALRLTAEEGWHRVSVAAAAREAGVPLPLARVRFPSRQAILLRFGQMADQAVLADVPSGDSVRDRLFDLLMRRLDAFQKHRPGVLAVLRAVPSDPCLAIMLTVATRRSMRWMLDAAGVSTAGLGGELRLRGLIGVWLWAVRAWQRDETEDLSATMAALDTALARAERVALWLHGVRRVGSPAAGEGPGEAAAGGDVPAGDAPPEDGSQDGPPAANPA